MNNSLSHNINPIEALIKKEGWEIKQTPRGPGVIAEGEEFPVTHPVAIHLKIYRTSRLPAIKYDHMVAAHNYLWPSHRLTWNYWSERRFRAHCEGWQCITYAGGAAIGKSFDAAKIAILFWLANPRKRAVLVMSTTLESLNSRIYGYVTRLLNDLTLDFPFKIYGGTNPHVGNLKRDTDKALDKLHCIKAVAAKRGDSDAAISSLIGRHPAEGLLVVADECTDLPTSILGAIPNLSSGLETFQFLGIGNSLSKFDLHGSLSTPNVGWDKIDPTKHTVWETTQENGLCLFFSCYDSPAIYETDPARREALSKFLVTAADIEDKKRVYGEESDAFWRFVIGFWRDEAVDETVISDKFIKEFDVHKRAEWSGLYPLSLVAGLDAAFSTGGDKCLLRVGVLGHDVNGQIVLDFRGDELLFKIEINPRSPDSAELQVAKQVITILKRFNIPLNRLAIDANGQGRALAEVIRLQAASLYLPIKIYSVKVGEKSKNSFDVIIKNTLELWMTFRGFIQHRQIRGLDNIALRQLTTRLIITKNGKRTLESKYDYKQRMTAVDKTLAHSPDEADCAALVVQAAIQCFGFSEGQRKDIQRIVDPVNEKYYVHQQMMQQENKKPAVSAPPIADCSGSLEDYILTKEPF